MASVRDFPGNGRLTEDPATSSSAVDDQMTIDDPQIAPFVTGIEAGANVVAISAATYPRLGEDLPAIYSRAVISGLLRDVIGFDGVVISADLSRTTSATTYPLKQRGVRFVQAGGDLVLSADPGRSRDLLTGLLAEDAKNPEFRDLVDDAALRVLALKAEHGIIRLRLTGPLAVPLGNPRVLMYFGVQLVHLMPKYRERHDHRADPLHRRQARCRHVRPIRRRVRPQHRWRPGRRSAGQRGRGHGCHRRCRTGPARVGRVESAATRPRADDVPATGRARHGRAGGEAVPRARQDPARRARRHPARCRGRGVRARRTAPAQGRVHRRRPAPASTCTRCASRSASSRASPRSTSRR